MSHRMSNLPWLPQPPTPPAPGQPPSGPGLSFQLSVQPWTNGWAPSAGSVGGTPGEDALGYPDEPAPDFSRLGDLDGADSVAFAMAEALGLGRPVRLSGGRIPASPGGRFSGDLRVIKQWALAGGRRRMALAASVGDPALDAAWRERATELGVALAILPAGPQRLSKIWDSLAAGCELAGFGTAGPCPDRLPASLAELDDPAEAVERSDCQLTNTSPRAITPGRTDRKLAPDLNANER